ncbi:hypothetical protein [Dysgonomonas macrotermitis]|uniref:Uncharacterized protein n=1 Tax=Dysgonomonas macrotermitis TaxID=1346286 RepID=A0A1M5C2N6_9BACT|nr:hypothetical protein [Dysgonomonas macrotermitis]SHF48877.1 hypothetical protein SAMN05444362_1074 [Dysgonomonas macrotermitis]
MKLPNLIINKLKASGFSNTGDNRSYNIRSLNNLLQVGMIDFIFASASDYAQSSKAFWYPCKDGKKRCTAYKVKILDKWYYGHFMPKSRTYRDCMGGKTTDAIKYSEIDLYDVLCRVARLISINKEGFDFLKNQINKHGACGCTKCNGTGIIPQFMHYAQGVCFECGGSGINSSILKSYIQSNVQK